MHVCVDWIILICCDRTDHVNVGWAQPFHVTMLQSPTACRHLGAAGVLKVFGRYIDRWSRMPRTFMKTLIPEKSLTERPELCLQESYDRYKRGIWPQTLLRYAKRTPTPCRNTQQPVPAYTSCVVVLHSSVLRLALLVLRHIAHA